MAFFDKIGKKIGDVAGSAADKAKELAEITKLNASISAEEKKIQVYYQEIGELIFQQDKENPNSSAAELCQKILASQRIIVEFKQNILELKEDKGVENPVPVDAMDITPEEQPQSGPQSEAQIICQNCGTVNPVTNKFCQNCGTALVAQK
ncbi:zinc-ribbon domain-containing protein [Desulfitobacterium sp. THU1]|uniref:zinc-ribbon domain-containing protein n=1 Tax=Desulfitobacterium sp. THU1 TaxID=3138072 RepID=UPI00311D7865